MKRQNTLWWAPLALVAGLYVVTNAFAADDNGVAKLRDAAQAAGHAADQRNLQINAEAQAQAEQHQADVQANLAGQSGVSGTIVHGAKAAVHKVKAIGDKTKATYHKAMANHYQHQAAADISATLGAH